MGNESEPALCLEQFFRLISGPLEGGAWSQANFEGTDPRRDLVGRLAFPHPPLTTSGAPQWAVGPLPAFDQAQVA